MTRFSLSPLLSSIILLALGCFARAESDLADLFAKASPSVVTLMTYSARGEKIGQGSGFIVDQSGLIVTSLHVVTGASIVEIHLDDNSTITAEALLHSDKDWDVALLKVPALPHESLKLAAPEAVRVGTSVVAIGSPLGYGNTLSQGIISGLRPHGDHSDLIQLTAPVSPGSSGGPILSASTGEVLGMTSSSQSNGQNINFAIPVRVLADQLKTTDQPPERKLEDFTPEVKKKIAAAKEMRDKLESECTEADANTINHSIEEAIVSGVGIFNSGDHLGCFRVYEGAAYKILYTLSDRCPTANSALKTALKKAGEADNSAGGATAKAWIMRNAFDSISGVRGKHP